MDPLRTRHKDVVFANGGKHKIVLELFKTPHRGSLFPIGEVLPLFLAVQHRFRYHLAGKDRTHMNPLRTRHSDVVFANGGGGAAPPPPPPATPPLSF